MHRCKNVYIAAWHLRGKMEKCGDTWTAVGAYHSETPAERDLYARHIAAIVRQWRDLPDASPTSSPNPTRIAKK